MAWLGKVTLGNFSDIAGAVNKLSESVKNIERNFDSALGFDDKEHNVEAQSSVGDRINLLEPVFAFVTQRDAQKDNTTKGSNASATVSDDVEKNESHPEEEHSSSSVNNKSFDNIRTESNDEQKMEQMQTKNSDQKETEPSQTDSNDEKNTEESQTKSSDEKNTEQLQTESNDEKNTEKFQTESSDEKTTDQLQVSDNESLQTDQVDACEKEEKTSELATENYGGTVLKEVSDIPYQEENLQILSKNKESSTSDVQEKSVGENDSIRISSPNASDEISSNGDAPTSNLGSESESMEREQATKNVGISIHDSHTLNPVVSDDEKVSLKAQLKMLEDALQGAAHQSKVKADELSRLSLENDNLRSTIEELKNKSSEAEIEALREEFQQRLNATERKVYALTKERDMLRREQGRKEASVLLKEKDEIIKQVMAEGEELSKKQAAQEATMRKLRAQIRELEEEKQRLKSKLQVEEATVESLRKDKTATEKALQEAVERTQVELAVQKEFYTNALNEAKEAEVRAEIRADNEAKLELERRLREAGDREAALVQNLDELRQALSRTAQQAAFKEDMLCKDIEDLGKRCQAAELRYEELVASVPESTRPLLRQIEAMQETMSARSEAWSGVERALNARLQEAEAMCAAAQERERAINERFSQTLSRMAVLEAQVSCLKAEQAQLTRSLEKERQRASENRQEYLVAAEAAATHEGHKKQLEDEIKEVRSRFKRELAEERTMRELLQQELELEKQKAIKREGLLGNVNWPSADKANGLHPQAPLESSPNRNLRRYSSTSAGSLEESYFLQVSLDSAGDQIALDRRNSNSVLSPYTVKGSMPNEQLESLLSQKDGEIALYTSRLSSLESTRNALAEELVEATTQCEKLRTEVASLPGLYAELESLRRRHTSALELMGERDEQVEELKADLADVKQMYREQIDMLVNQIEQLSASVGSGS